MTKPTKQVAAKKTATKKTATKKVAAKKTATKKAAAKKTATKKAAAKKPAAPASVASGGTKVQGLRSRDRDVFKKMLLRLRERLSGQISSLKSASLTRADSVYSEEDGTDAFDRQFALTLASSENESVLEIDEALRRLEEKSYGVCESCGDNIKKPRLQALPFVRKCIRCQSEEEKRHRGFRAAASL